MSRRTPSRALRWIGAYALYGVLALGPAAVAIALDWSVYTGTPQRCFSLTVAGMVALTLVVLQAMGHSPKNVRRVVWYGLGAALLWALRPIVQSLAILLTAMTAGELLAMLVAQPILGRLRRTGNNAALAAALREGVQEAVGEIQGRV